MEVETTLYLQKEQGISMISSSCFATPASKIEAPTVPYSHCPLVEEKEAPFAPLKGEMGNRGKKKEEKEENDFSAILRDSNSTKKVSLEQEQENIPPSLVSPSVIPAFLGPWMTYSLEDSPTFWASELDLPMLEDSFAEQEGSVEILNLLQANPQENLEKSENSPHQIFPSFSLKGQILSTRSLNQGPSIPTDSLIDPRMGGPASLEEKEGKELTEHSGDPKGVPQDFDAFQERSSESKLSFLSPYSSLNPSFFPEHSSFSLETSLSSSMLSLKDQMQLSCRQAVEKGESYFRIELFPESLGWIDVTLSLKEGKSSTAHFRMDSSETLSVLALSQEKIKSIFEEAGLLLDHLTFQTDDPQNEDQHDQEAKGMKNLEGSMAGFSQGSSGFSESFFSSSSSFFEGAEDSARDKGLQDSTDNSLRHASSASVWLNVRV